MTPGRVEKRIKNFLKRLFELSLGSGGSAENVNCVRVVEEVIVSYTHRALHVPRSVSSCTVNSTRRKKHLLNVEMKMRHLRQTFMKI